MMKLLFFDMNTIRTKEALHEAFQKKLELPAYYGKNLDAFYDVLSEGAINAMLVFENCECADGEMSEYLDRLKEIGKRLEREGLPLSFKFFR